MTPPAQIQPARLTIPATLTRQYEHFNAMSVLLIADRTDGFYVWTQLWAVMN